MKEEVQGGPARGRGHDGRGTHGRGRGRCANRGRGLIGLEDAAVGGGCGGAADRGHGYGRERGRGHGRGRISNIDRQRLVDAFEDGDDYHELAALLSIPYQTARSIIRVWLAEGRVQSLPEGGARNIKLTVTCKPSLETSRYNSLSPPSPRLVRNWRFASRTRQFQTSNFVSQPGTFKTSSSPPRLLERTAMYRMKEIISTQSSDVFNTPHGWST